MGCKMDEKSKALPKTVAQAVNLLLSDLSLQEKTAIANMQKDNLVDLHFSLGRLIRNEFKLQTDNKELVESCRLLSGKRDLHADDVSSVIIESLWENLQDTHVLRVVK